MSNVNCTKEESETWLREFLEKNGNWPTYDEVIDSVRGVFNENNIDRDQASYIYEDRFSFYGTLAYGEIPDEFWNHVENVVDVKQELRPTYFTCSC